MESVNDNLMKRLILASSSPRRKILLAKTGLAFEVLVSAANETYDPSLSCQEIVQVLARRKAAAVAHKIDGPAVILGADTIVCCDNKILGKPENEYNAAQMLKMLSDRTHQVLTGYCLLDTETHKTICGCEQTAVTFKPLTQSEIAAYIQTGEPMDKAGAYGIQGKGGAFVQSVDGSYDNVVGLPTERIAALLQKEFGFTIMDRKGE